MQKSEIAKEHIKILKKARKRIQDHKNFFVCHAIEFVTGNDQHPLIKHIQAELNKHLVLGSFDSKSSRVIEEFVEYHDKELAAILFKEYKWREYRIAWLNKWIKDLEKEI